MQADRKRENGGCKNMSEQHNVQARTKDTFSRSNIYKIYSICENMELCNTADITKKDS